MFNNFKVFIVLFISLGLLVACGESDTPQETTSTSTEKSTSEAVEIAAAPAIEEAATQLPAKVEEMAAIAEEKAEEVVEAVKEEAEAAGDKPYQIVDGAISANAIEGWKTYNGGGCGACHGQGAKGAVGPNLGESVTQKLTKEEFVDVVVNGRSGTFMKPHKSNKRVMDNLDNLYAYFMARGDDVLGPENLIKFPMGKQE
jgi:mono/diheme cytochrome c family protein